MPTLQRVVPKKDSTAITTHTFRLPAQVLASALVEPKVAEAAAVVLEEAIAATQYLTLSRAMPL